MQELKFKIKNERHSEKIQKALFELGFGWEAKGGDTEVKHTDAPYIYLEDFGTGDLELAWNDESSHYEGCDSRETALRELKFLIRNK